MEHWQQQIADRGGVTPLVVEDAPAAPRTNCGGRAPERRPPAITIEPDSKFGAGMVVINWLRIWHTRVTWWTFALWLARFPLRGPMRLLFWASRWYLKWKLRRYAERGPKLTWAQTDERLNVCGGCDKREPKDDGDYCGACQCPPKPRASLNRKVGMANARCPIGRWNEPYPRWMVFAYSVLNAACKTCGAAQRPAAAPADDKGDGRGNG